MNLKMLEVYVGDGEKNPKQICKREVYLGSPGLVLLHLISVSKNFIKIFIVLLIKMTMKCCLHYENDVNSLCWSCLEYFCRTCYSVLSSIWAMQKVLSKCGRSLLFPIALL